jgi:uncharacterized cupredoxin-like copper-binding protein
MKQLAVSLIALVLVACSGSATGTPSGPTPVRTVAVTLTDEMRIQPDPIKVGAHETVRFVVTNTGATAHEMFIGDESEQAAHEEEMRDGQMAHDHSNAVSVDPGATAELIFSFGIPGAALAGCHIPGHYPAGMKAALVVE